MPTYTYRCTKCGQEIEVVQSMSDPPLQRCKKCRGKLQRTFHPVGIVLKGSGFHKTDYRSPASKGSSSESSEKTSDAKPEKKSETKSSDAKKDSGSSSSTGSTSKKP